MRTVRPTRAVLVSLALACLTLVLTSAPCSGAESSASPSANRLAETNTGGDELLRAYLQFQEQLRATQLAVERNRQDADAAAAANAKELSGRLQAIEQALAGERAQELEAMQSSNRVILIVAGLFATLGFVAMIFMAYLQWRTINQLAEISAAMPGHHMLGPGPAVAALGPGEGPLVTTGEAELSSLRLLGAIDRLEKRIRELEYTAHTPLNGGASKDLESKPANGEPAQANEVATTPAAQAAVLLGKGQSLLNLDKADEALVCFEEVLARDAHNTEALVKKGAALERLRRPDEAIRCYDRAIALDGSLTIAYLCKGGLCNRLERFNEALQCYEQALRTQEKKSA